MTSAVLDRLQDDQAMGLVAKIEDAFKTLPRLPKGFVEFMVKIAPWLALIGGILSLVAGPVLGLLSVVSLLTLNPLLVVSTVVAAILSLANAALLLMAFGPLKQRQFKGWMFVFWSEILGIVQTILGILMSQSSIISIVFALIGLYILFEMKPMYTGKGVKAE
jgi:lysylphosphatidylglycerol synthetase-like protein (DUF2156 family)